MNKTNLTFFCALINIAFSSSAFAQTQGTLNAKPLPKIEINANTPAKELFGRAKSVAPLKPTAIGGYARGCLAGGEAFPLDTANSQVMRLSRNRMYGHPELIDFLHKFSRAVPKHSDWKGILIGDMSQPRGGPMLTGHASHQIGLDADIWLTPMPNRTLTREEREMTSAVMMVRADRKDVSDSFTQDHVEVVKLAAQDPRVERILINPAIKKALCREATGNRLWLKKVRPYWGHDYHMHVRLGCPKGSENHCSSQDPVVAGEGCDLDWWFTDEVLNPKPAKPSATPPKPKPPMTMASLPAECMQVLKAE